MRIIRADRLAGRRRGRTAIEGAAACGGCAFESIDPAGVAMMKQWLRRFTTQGRTVFLTTHVLETAERLCDRAAIIKSPGRVVWHGDLTPLASGGSIDVDGRSFRTLESLFLHIAGARYPTLEWL